MESLFQFKEFFLQGILSGNITPSERRYLFYTNEKNRDTKSQRKRKPKHIIKIDVREIAGDIGDWIILLVLCLFWAVWTTHFLNIRELKEYVNISAHLFFGCNCRKISYETDIFKQLFRCSIISRNHIESQSVQDKV